MKITCGKWLIYREPNYTIIRNLCIQVNEKQISYKVVSSLITHNSLAEFYWTIHIIIWNIIPVIFIKQYNEIFLIKPLLESIAFTEHFHLLIHLEFPSDWISAIEKNSFVNLVILTKVFIRIKICLRSIFYGHICLYNAMNYRYIPHIKTRKTEIFTESL